MERLLQKFLESDVIVEVRGKVKKFSEEDSYLYQFVTEPGPLNFVEEKAAEEPAKSPLGKHPRTKLELYDGTLIANEYAFVKCNDSLKKPRRSAVNKLAVFDVNTQSTKLSPSQVAEVWKELTLARYSPRSVVGLGGCDVPCSPPADCCVWWSCRHWMVCLLMMQLMVSTLCTMSIL